MPSKNLNPPMPHLDPKYDPNHPANNVPEIILNPEDEIWMTTPSEAENLRRQKKWVEEQLASYSHPHVLRSWENMPQIAEYRNRILSMILKPKPVHDFMDLIPANPNDSSVSRKIARAVYNEADDPDGLDFRRFVNKNFKVAYHRFHATQGDPGVEDQEDPPVDEEDICWLMEYSDPECSIVRRGIAEKMGMFPAMIDESNPLFDFDAKIDYDKRIYTRCRRKNKKCIRPSHIMLFGSNFQEIP